MGRALEQELKELEARARRGGPGHVMRLARWAVAVLAAGWAAAAAAHPVGLSRGEYRLEGGALASASTPASGA